MTRECIPCCPVATCLMPLQLLLQSSPASLSFSIHAGCSIVHFLRLCSMSASQIGTSTHELGSNGPYVSCMASSSTRRNDDAAGMSCSLAMAYGMATHADAVQHAACVHGEVGNDGDELLLCKELQLLEAHGQRHVRGPACLCQNMLAPRRHPLPQASPAAASRHGWWHHSKRTGCALRHCRARPCA